jgi:hypothetical protein
LSLSIAMRDRTARQSLEPQPLGGCQGYGAHRFHSSEISAARPRASKSGSDPDFQEMGSVPFLNPSQTLS